MNQRGVRQSFTRSQSSSTKEKLLQYSDMKAKKTPKMTSDYIKLNIALTWVLWHGVLSAF